MNRNLSPYEMFVATAEEHHPAQKFSATTKHDFEKWKSETLPKVLSTLGKSPERLPLRPEILAEWEHDGLIKQRWVIDVQKHLSAIFVICFQKNILKKEKRPALLCWHGHGKFGKESVMGNDSSPERKADIERQNYDYGHQMAKKGFVTFAIDWIGHGEMDDANGKYHRRNFAGGNWCNMYYLHATMLGMTPLSIIMTHGKAAIDFAQTFENVDPDRIGVMGLSGGGTLSLWTSLCDERIKATEIICYSDLWINFGFKSFNYCGMQVAPGLYALVDLPDLQGLLAPRPLLIDIGAYDSCFPVDGALSCYRQLEGIYLTAGAKDKLELDYFPGEHAWGGNKSADFFGKYL